MDNPDNDIQSSDIGRKWAEYPLGLWQVMKTWWRSSRSWESERYTWRISDFGNVSIIRESSGNYLALISATLTYKNTDDRCPLDIFPSLVMYISHIGSGRAGDYYKLLTQDLGIQRIAPDDSLNVNHTFSMRTSAPPLLSGIAKCIIRGTISGEMNLPTGVIKGKLKLDGNNTFDTKVTKEWIRE
ncbi:MAG: hypothetical protein JSU79_06650 [Dehalococcoidales bacterium]|nr:MAG: hypothetical protein JSU79_06650 [Dehalococcoidales bacterium]